MVAESRSLPAGPSGQFRPRVCAGRRRRRDRRRGSGDSGEAVGTILGWVGVLPIICALVYQVIREGRTGQTLGKAVLGIRAVRDRDGRTLGIGRALGRRLLQPLNCVVLGLGWSWPLWDDRRQTFADKIVGAVVLRVEAPLPHPVAFQQ
ncbi:RDD family protein [Streptomyces chiangmaiensis]